MFLIVVFLFLQNKQFLLFKLFCSFLICILDTFYFLFTFRLSPTILFFIFHKIFHSVDFCFYFSLTFYLPFSVDLVSILWFVIVFLPSLSVLLFYSCLPFCPFSFFFSLFSFFTSFFLFVLPFFSFLFLLSSYFLSSFFSFLFFLPLNKSCVNFEELTLDLCLFLFCIEMQILLPIVLTKEKKWFTPLDVHKHLQNVERVKE